MFGGHCDTAARKPSVSGSLPTLKIAFSGVGRSRTCGLKLETKEGGSCPKAVQQILLQ